MQDHSLWLQLERLPEVSRLMSNIPAGGEILLRLKERIDRNKDVYLFGSLRLFNVVIFIRKDKSRPGEWQATIRPYLEAGKLEEGFDW